MLSAERNGLRCYYCALRSRRAALQQSRSRSIFNPLQSRDRTRFEPALRRGETHDAVRRERGFDVRKERGFDVRRERNFDQRYPERRGTRNARGSYDATWKSRGPSLLEVVLERLKAVKKELKDSPILEQLRKEGREADFESIWKRLETACKKPPQVDGSSPESNIKADLKDALVGGRETALDARIKYHFYDLAIGPRFSDTDIQNQRILADLRYPAEWYPATRTLHRTVHLHVGPTNSGKTYHALQRLEQARSGIYAGPLRLLAHEVYARLNAKDIPCSLLTGEERRTPPGHEAGPALDANGEHRSMAACTVEMMPVNKTVDVAVIDEIQMIGSADRGWAWTSALLGVKATELHLCGEERTVPIVQQICATLHDELVIHRYERLSPLRTADRSLDGNLRNLKKGDCVISFSVMGIHALRNQIERDTGKKVATVYGSLPPETRAQQARLFNDPDNDYDYLVASDAVGMGLNLAIRRVIFETLSKFDGSRQRILPIADIKQIAGRAGRFRIALQKHQEPASEEELAAAKADASAKIATGSENTGFVTTLEAADMPVLKAAMKSEPEPIVSAGIYPPGAILERFSNYFPPGTPFSYIMTKLHDLCQMHSRFHLCGLKDQVWVADLIEPIKNLTISDRNIICASPASSRDGVSTELLPALAKCIAEQKDGDFLDIKQLPLEILEREPSPDREYLRALEGLHKGISLYLWLSYRFPGVLRSRALALHTKQLVEEKIEAALSKMSFSASVRKKIVANRRRLAEEASREDTKGIKDELPALLHEQSSMIGGGDRFSGGGEDVPLDDPRIDVDLDGIAREDTSQDDEQNMKPGTIPSKHLPDLDFMATETERRVDSRP